MYNYIITSDDKEALNDKIDEIIKSANMELDVSKYDLVSDDIYDILDEIRTISLFQTTKLIVISSAEKITEISEAKLNDLTKEMNNLNSENIIIFTSLNQLDFRNNMLAQIRRFSTLIDVNTKNVSFEKYIKNYVENNGYTISEDGVNTLASYVDSISSLKQSLEILICYKADEKNITYEDVILMIRKPLEDSVYELISAVLDQNKKRVFEVYKDLNESNMANPTGIISILINKFHELYNAYIIADMVKNKNEAEKKVSEIFGVSIKRAYYMVKNTRNTNMREILRNIKLLDELDYNIKSGQIAPDLGIELYFLR